MPEALELREGGRLNSVALPHSVAVAVAALNVATVVPASLIGEYNITNIRKVGVLVIEGLVVRIQPKTPVHRLFAMLSYARNPEALWRDEPVHFDADDDLYSAIAYAYSTALGRTLGAGILKGYLSREEALPMVRGRWRVTDQLTRRAGQPLPLEISYDDFVEDIPLNRILKSAAARLLRFPGLSGEVTTQLRRSLRRLSEVSLLIPGAPLPRVAIDRATARHRAALELAKLILSDASLEHQDGSTIGSGFLVDLWTVFEDFVSTAIVSTSTRIGIDVRTQLQSRLDLDGRVGVAPDLAWLRRGHVKACADVKYKIEHHGQFPNADIYQMLAYCTRFGLPEGHLIYAAGEAEPRRIELVNGPVIVQHAVRLGVPFDELLTQVESLAAQIGLTATIAV